MENNYYIVSPKWTRKHDLVWTFWRDNSCGYTFNLDEAGLYEFNINKPYPTLMDKTYLAKLLKDHDTFFIHKDNIEWLGKKITCIMR